MENYDVIVVGAGISGMSFAHYATKSDNKTLVLEKSDRIGGSFHSSISEDDSRDFWLELGAHTCYNSYRSLIEVIEDCGIVNQIIPRAKVPFRLLKDKQVKSFPSQINFLELLISVPKLFTKKKEGETVKSYYGSIVGKKNFKKVFSALFSAVPSQNADDFPADALFKKRERRKDILKHYTMKNGLGSITEVIAQHNKCEVKLNTEIGKIDKTESGYTIKTNQGVFTCKQLSICTSITSVPDLIGGIFPTVVDKVAKIKNQKIESFGVVIPKDATEIKPFAGLVPTDDDFFSAVSRDTVPNENYRGFTFHFKPDILSPEQKLEKACEVLGIKSNQIIEVREKLNIVPSLRLGHYELIDEIDNLLKGGDLFMSGNYFAGLSIEDCVSRSKAEVKRMVSSLGTIA
jgi:oxygen-dependent protoporphyrinogen oxidase